MRFRAELESHGRTATGVDVPAEVVRALGAGGRPPVAVTVNGYTWRTSIASTGGRFMVGVSAQARAGAGVTAGDVLDVEVGHDAAPRAVDVPEDLAAARTRAEPVQADTRRRWSATRRGSRSAVVGPAQPQPDLLDSIVGLVERAEHAVGHRPQVGAVLLEAPGQVIAVLHGHLLRSGSLIPVTSRVAPM